MNVPDDKVLGIAGARQAANAFGDGQRAPSVRRATEALFKPTIDAPPSTDEPSHRMPRIFYVPPAAPARAEVERPATAPIKRQIGSEHEDATGRDENSGIRLWARPGFGNIWHDASASCRIVRGPS
jgi:hypothetical protein